MKHKYLYYYTIKVPIFITLLLLSMFSLSGCSILDKIAGYNLDSLDQDKTEDAIPVLTLPESTYKKEALEISMSNPTSLNPLDPVDYTVDQVLKLVYDPLLTVLPDNSLEYNLIESYESISPTALRVSLKKNISFHNELPLQAEDVLFSFQYIQSQPNSTYSFVANYIASITIIDEYTFDIVFIREDRYNLYCLTFPIISKVYTSSEEFMPLSPVGSGPYKLDFFQTMINLELVRNEKYHQSLPDIQKISVTITRKFEDGYNMFTSKRIDVFSPLQTNWHNYSNDTNLQIDMFDSPFFYYVGVNHSERMLADMDGRRLIASNIPYDAIKKDAFLGHIKFTTLPILPELQQQLKLDAYYSINAEDSFYMREYAPDSVFKYLSKLRDKGYPIIDQVPITYQLIYNSDEIYQAYIAKEISAKNNHYPLIIRSVGLNTQDYYTALKQKKYDLFIGTLKTSFIPELTSFFGTNGLNNITGYSNINIDGLLASYKMVQTETSFIKQIENLSKVISEQLPIIPLGFLENGLFSHQLIENKGDSHYYHVYQSIYNMKVK